MNRPAEPSLAFGDAVYVAALLERTKDVKHARRLSAIRYRMLGYAPHEVCRLLNISAESLRKWVKAWNTAGEKGLLPIPRRGRPQKLGPEIRDLVVKNIQGTMEDGIPFTATLFHGYLKKTP